MGISDHTNNEAPVFVSKKCPGCLTSLPLDATHCTSCKKKIGKVNKNGIAKFPIDWMSYVICFLSISGFCLYIWWAFLK